MLENQSSAFSRRRGISIVLGGLTLAIASAAAAQSPETVLYNFSGGSDGASPAGGLIADSAGNFYGATESGGTIGAGTIYELTPGGSETPLYYFCSGSKCRDGSTPNTGVIPIADSAGNLYGTTFVGGSANCGSQGCGTVWKLAPGGTWTESVLHRFTGSKDGDYPLQGLTIDANNNLYGTTLGGGRGTCVWSQNGLTVTGCGTIFKIASDGTFSTLYSFKGGSDGANPTATLVLDTDGNLYGTTLAGGTGTCSLLGTSGCGSVFKITPDRREKQLHAFGGGSDGANPADFGGGLLLHKGVLYGTTYDGGAMNAGTVFALTKKGAETWLYPLNGTSDGANPWSGVIADKGYLYGTAQNGGSNSGGVVFKIAPGGSETVLYDFCSKKNCTDGSGSRSELLTEGHHLYGTTSGGGAYGEGTVFSIDLKAASEIR